MNNTEIVQPQTTKLPGGRTLNSQVWSFVVGYIISHWAIDDEGHHDVHISDVVLQVGIRQVQLCAPVSIIKTSAEDSVQTTQCEPDTNVRPN